MKILKIRFKNLNSLVGEWSIDFTSPEYVNDGIFAISGPTGAGKSTILDAICLGLYGCTPRLGSITKASNEIISRHTGECFAEVIFQVNDVQIRAHWSQQRAHRRINGELQSPKHEISMAESGEILSNQITTSKKVVEEKTGMDFTRFTQSMLLAQGGFAAFLNATGSERAPILEQITGTDIYSKISTRVFEFTREEKSKLENLQSRMSGIIVIAEDEEIKLKEEIKEKETSENSLKETIDKLNAAINWISNIENLKKELNEISKKEEELSSKIEEFEPLRIKLQEALRANEIEGEYSTLKALRSQLIESEGLLLTMEQQRPVLEENAQNAEEQYKEAASKKDEAEKSKESVKKITDKVRTLDQNINDKSGTISKLNEELKSKREKLEGLNSDKKISEESLSSLNEQIKNINLYLENNSFDKSLTSELGGIKANIILIKDLVKNQKSLQEKYDEQKKKVNTKKEEILKSTTNFNDLALKHNQALDSISKKSQEINVLLNGNTKEEIKAEEAKLYKELMKRQKIADFDSERLNLEDNKPCPLCGSIHHPYAMGNIPVSDEITEKLEGLKRLLTNIDNLEAQKSNIEKTERLTHEQLIKAEGELSLKKQNLNNLESTLNDSIIEINRVTSLTKENVASLNIILNQYGLEIKDMSDNTLDDILGNLTERNNKWQEYNNNLAKFNKGIIEGQNNLNILNVHIENGMKELELSEITYRNLHSDIQLLKSERLDLFGNKNPNDEDNAAGNLFKQAEENYTDALLKRQSCIEFLRNNGKSIKEQIEHINKKRSDLEALESNFTHTLTNYNFSSEDAFLATRMSPEERNNLNSRAAFLDNEKTKLETQKKDRMEKLENLLALNITDEQIDVLQNQLSENNDTFKDINEKRIALQEKLRINEDAKTRFEQLIFEVNIQKAELERWTRLNNLIGSLDGKKFRNFAQGLTFELMVRYANQQLAKLSERYLLIRDNKEPLDLNVIDNYQAGEIRSTRNLSGGESFIVSLALSLGLSKMSSKNVRVDSLFLDEGFGTLDDDTLETAMSTLAGLHQDGKIIGIISHVGALQERINTRISVKPEREGRSIISGPGCMRITTS
ncbi:MAG: hypothetical protein KA807_11645 [Prolixibacteraceae bacterium]|nr:hypothetical protein [Prolixibacteraceae bacterium]